MAQEMLKEAWTGGRVGNLSALEQLKAIAYRDVYKEAKGKASWEAIARRLAKRRRGSFG